MVFEGLEDRQFSSGANKVAVHDLCKDFYTAKRSAFYTDYVPNIRALDRIDLTIGALSFVSIVGPSGCGKTTLLRIVAGLESMTSGEVTIDDEPVGKSRLGTAVVFQHVGLLPWRTVTDNVLLALRLKHHRKPSVEEIEFASSCIDLVGLGQFRDTKPAQLSGGMQQRVGIARSLAVKPDLLLMDEPFGALDAQTRWILQDELMRICDHYHSTVLFVTHDIEEAICLSDQVVVMSRIPGTIKDIIDIPFSRPRSIEDTKALPEFESLRQRIWEELRGEITL